MLQLTMLDIVPGQEVHFEATFETARHLLLSAPGHIKHSLSRSVESPSRYVLLVEWRHLSDHTIRFRQADDHIQWKALLTPFYSQAPQSLHFEHLHSSDCKPD